MDFLEQWHRRPRSMKLWPDSELSSLLKSRFRMMRWWNGWRAGEYAESVGMRRTSAVQKPTVNDVVESCSCAAMTRSQLFVNDFGFTPKKRGRSLITIRAGRRFGLRIGDP